MFNRRQYFACFTLNMQYNEIAYKLKNMVYKQVFKVLQKSAQKAPKTPIIAISDVTYKYQ